ncbi:MAG: ABC transporter substrate-binding protein [Candidatus Paceibacterota bacterium]
MSLTLSQKRILFGVVVGIILFFVLIFSFRQPKQKPVTLTIWALEDELKTFQPILNQFRAYYPNVQFNYVLKDESTFEKDYLQALADNKAPDLFMVYDSWLSRYWNRIYFFDLSKEKNFTPLYIKQIYPDNIVFRILPENRYLTGIPLYIDTLALYYNQDIFNYFNIPLPPKSWQEVINLIPKLRKVNEKGQIERSAIALGTIENIDNFKDILAMLLFNFGNPIIKADKQSTLNEKTAQEAINFYLQFSNPRSSLYTYNENFPSSLKSFAEGKTVMVLGYYTDSKIIKAYNSLLNYKVAPLPYLRSPEEKINYPKSLIVVASDRSSKLDWAFLFLKFLSQRQTGELYFSLTGKPPARRDLIEAHLNDLRSGIFIQQILTSRFFYQFNDEKITEIFKTLLKEIVYQNYEIEKALKRAQDRFEFYWQQK